MRRIMGERLKKLRTEARISQVSMAEIVGTQQSSIYRYEKGQSVPVPEILVSYAEYFGVSMDYLYGRTEDPQGSFCGYHRQSFTSRYTDSNDMNDFIEMCFDPESPANARLREALLQILREGSENT